MSGSPRRPASWRRPSVRVQQPQLTPPRVRRRPSTGPLWALVLAVLVLGGTLLGRLWQLQLAPPDTAAPALAPVDTRELTTPALRGDILAADGTPLVTHAPTVVVTIEPEALIAADDGGRALVTRVADALDLPAGELWGRTRLCGTPEAPPAPRCFSGSPYEPVPLAEGVDEALALHLLERPEDVPGVAVRTEPVRVHPAPLDVNAAHLLGYLGRPTQAEVEASGGAVLAQDRLGRAGLEQAYDAELRGTPGTSTVAVDPRGVVTEWLSSTAPTPGADLRTHLDLPVQAAAEQALADAVADARERGAPARSAAAVVLRPQDGAVHAAASWPTYDPGVWAGGVSQAEYDRLVDPAAGQPLLDRVIAQTLPPASTFKVVSLPAALQTGVDIDGRYPCPGSVTIAGQRFTNYESQAYGRLSLPEILEVSCDTSFYTWAYDDWRALGGIDQESDEADRLLALTRGMGLGRRTGIDLPGEVAGTVPSRQARREQWLATRQESCAQAEQGYPEIEDEERRDYLEQVARENCVDGWQWRPGDAANLSIGQGDLAVTPLQLAVVYGAIASGGELWQPQVGAALERQTPGGPEVIRLDPVSLGSVSIDPAALAVVREGLEAVNITGTAAGAFAGWPHEDYPLAGKTGSAEALGQEATSWYASYGPVEDPRYVVVVVVEEGGLGADAAAPAARAIWEVLADRP